MTCRAGPKKTKLKKKTSVITQQAHQKFAVLKKLVEAVNSKSLIDWADDLLLNSSSPNLRSASTLRIVSYRTRVRVQNRSRVVMGGVANIPG